MSACAGVMPVLVVLPAAGVIDAVSGREDAAVVGRVAHRLRLRDKTSRASDDGRSVVDHRQPTFGAAVLNRADQVPAFRGHLGEVHRYLVAVDLRQQRGSLLDVGGDTDVNPVGALIDRQVGNVGC